MLEVSGIRMAPVFLAGIISFLFLYVLPANATSDSYPAGIGEAIYQRSCVACHGPDGIGAMPGIPDLTRVNGPLSKSDDRLIQSLVNGVETEGAPLTMPAMRDEEGFKEQEAKMVLEYIRREFGD